MLYLNPDIESSFQENDLGRTLYDLVLQLKPRRIIEFGALEGYSTVCMAMALDELGKGRIYSYDLWQDYPHRHSNIASAMTNAMRWGVGKYIQFGYQDFWHWEPQRADLILLDISNDGKIIKKAVKKIREAGITCPIVFEGGSQARDQVDWMKRYKKEPITTCGVKYQIINSKFPSLSIT